MEFFAEFYTTFKVIHVIAFCSWMAFLFYAPRLFVYHTEHRDNAEYVRVVEVQERKLFNMIGYPAIVVTFATGIAMILGAPSMMRVADSGAWLHWKLLCVIALALYHASLYFIMKSLAAGKFTRSGKFYRIYNEVPTILLIAIAILVVAKPI